MSARIALMIAGWLFLAPNFPDLLGECEVVAAQDEAREITKMPPVAHFPGFDALCRDAKEALEIRAYVEM